MTFRDLDTSWAALRVEMCERLDAIPATRIGEPLVVHPIAGAGLRSVSDTD